MCRNILRGRYVTRTMCYNNSWVANMGTMVYGITNMGIAQCGPCVTQHMNREYGYSVIRAMCCKTHNNNNALTTNMIYIICCHYVEYQWQEWDDFRCNQIRRIHECRVKKIFHLERVNILSKGTGNTQYCIHSYYQYDIYTIKKVVRDTRGKWLNHDVSSSNTDVLALRLIISIYTANSDKRLNHILEILRPQFDESQPILATERNFIEIWLSTALCYALLTWYKFTIPVPLVPAPFVMDSTNNKPNPLTYSCLAMSCTSRAMELNVLWMITLVNVFLT